MTIVFDDMQAPILTLGTRRWRAPAATVSSAVNGGTFRLGTGCSGCCVVASPGQAGRSRNAPSKQERPTRFRILIDIQNLSYTKVSGHFRLLTGSEGGHARRTVSRPRPPRILCAKYPSRLSVSTQHQLVEATSRCHPAGREAVLSIALMTSAWAAVVSLAIRQPDRPAVFSGRPGPVRLISVASAANRLLRYRCPRRWCPWPAEPAALACRITGPARRIRRTRQPVTPKAAPGHPPDRRVW